MKNTMKKLTAALLAMACVPVTGLTAAGISSVDLDNPWWGNVQWNVFADQEPVNDHGMITGTDGLLYIADSERYCYLLEPRKTHMEFVLRDNVDADTAGSEMIQIVDECFPGIKDAQEPYDFSQHLYHLDSVTFCQTMDKTFSLDCEELPDNAEDIETKLLIEFAQRGLISEFYGWGATAHYSNRWFPTNNVLDYSEKREVRHPEAVGTPEYITYESIDWDNVQMYLDKNHSGLTVEHVEEKIYLGYTDYVCIIRGVDSLTFREKIELAGELYENLGIEPRIAELQAPAKSTLGHNALERPGDTNLDCEVNILDVIAANKHILGVGTLDKTGLKNADMDGNGTEDSADSLAILKAVLGITD